MVSYINIPVFNGQGTAGPKLSQMRELALQDASRPAGSVLLAACHAAFHTELSTLPVSECEVDLSDFSTKESLLTVSKERYAYNAIISGSTLFLLQTLRYLAFIDASNSLTPFSDSLNLNATHGVGVLGFSSGILPATVVGTSLSLAAFLHNALESYRLALWIGVRTQRYRSTILRDSFIEPAAPWSLVFLGTSKDAIEEGIAEFTKTHKAAPLHVTAIIDSTCVTVSGRPDTLSAFAKEFNAPVHKMALETLYHASVHESEAREAVLADAQRRDIQFPRLDDIRIPIRSSFTGELIDATMADGKSLLELVVDMILTQPVNWDLVSQGVTSLSLSAPVRIMNLGPGGGLMKSLAKDLAGEVTTWDLSVSNLGRPPKQDPIAIVGMAVNMPGAPSVSKLWEVLEQGINTISEIPENRFKISDYKEGKRQMKAHTGNFVDNVDKFDNKFFKISPREARSMDPQQRVLLHTAYEALEDAGYVPNSTPSFNPDTFGCYIGVATNDYVQNLRNDIDVYYSTGTLKAFLSGRLSYAMQLSGPSIVLDTACSSSGVAVYQGARALMNGDCKAALVGGVNVISSPDMFLGLDRGHFLSPTGQCKSFDASADGYSRSEGVGLFVLKQLSDAIAENDHIWGVIRGVEVNQSGLASSITHPHAPTQVKLFNTVLANAGVTAERVNVIEAHGTGTQAGDPGELESIRGVFSMGEDGRPLHVTSIKANIGHLEAASGAAGLAKLLLMLRYRTIPRLISLKNLNPKIPAGNGIIIDRAAVSWPVVEDGLSRMALLNNFGAAGSNSAILVEEHVSSIYDADMPLVLGLSAKTADALNNLKERYIKWMGNSTETWSNIAYTATGRRQLYAHRIAVSANNKEDAVKKLEKSKAIEVSLSAAKPNLVFVFSGQGAQYLGMGKALYETSPLVKSIVDECNAFLVNAGFIGVLPIILANGESSGLAQTEEFEAYQPAIFVLEYALARLWMSWGVLPSVVVGHSLGEYAALVIANVLTWEGALTIVAHRVRLMVTKCEIETTGMMAVNLAASSLEAHLSSFGDLSVACLNSTTDCVLSGPLETLRKFKEYLDATSICKNVVLSVPFGYHSSAMNPLLDDLSQIASRVSIQAPTLPIISNVEGETVLPGDVSVFNATYFAKHCAQPVQFDKGVNSFLKQDRVNVWLEIGPHTACLPMIKSIVKDEALLLPSLKKQQDPWTTLTATLVQLYRSNITVDWRKTYEHIPSIACVSLPSYPFAPSAFWVAFKEEAATEQVIHVDKPRAILSDYAMLNQWVQKPGDGNGFTSVFETPIKQLASSISGHQVAGLPLCPASVYLEQVFAGIAISWSPSNDRHTVLRGITFVNALVYDQTVPRIVITSITLDNDTGTFIVSSRVDGSADPVSLHARGEFKLQSTATISTKFSRALPAIKRNIGSIMRPGLGHETFTTRTIYESLFPRVVDYSKEYHTMQSLTIDASQMEGAAHVRLPADHDKGKHVVHPVFLDTLLHAAGFVANLQGARKDAFICTEVGSVKVLPELVDLNANYTVYCSNVWMPDEGVIVAEAWACQEGDSSKIVAYMKGMQFRRLRLDSFSRMLAKAAGKTVLPSGAPNVKRTINSAKPTSPTNHIPTVVTAASTISVESTVLTIVAETCGIDVSTILSDTDLEALGVDSLMSIEIFGRLRTSFPAANLQANVLSSCKTSGDIVRAIGLVQTVTKSVATARPIPAKIITVASTSSVESTVLDIVAETCGIDVSTILPDTDLEALGVDSLMSIEIFGRLQTSFPDADLQANILASCKTSGDIVREIGHVDTGVASSMSSGLSSPVTLVPEDESVIGNEVVDIKGVLANVLGVSVSDIKDNTDFEHLGLDSLTSIEALHELKTQLELELPGNFFELYSTVDAVRGYLDSSSKKAKKVDSSHRSSHDVSRFLRLDVLPSPIQKAPTTTSNLPLFLFHDGSGLVNYYSRMAPLNRFVWGLHNPKFATSEPWNSVVEMATAYADNVARKSAGPVLLGGWSFGGVAAYEAALQLSKRGITVKGLVLIDAPNPENHVPLSASLIAAAAKLNKEDNSEVGKLVQAQFALNSAMLRDYNPFATQGTCPPVVYLRSTDGFSPVGVRDVPIWLSDRSQRNSGWEKIAKGELKVLDIPGNHFQAFHPDHINTISSRIAEGCAYLQSL